MADSTSDKDVTLATPKASLCQGAARPHLLMSEGLNLGAELSRNDRCERLVAYRSIEDIGCRHNPPNDVGRGAGMDGF